MYFPFFEKALENPVKVRDWVLNTEQGQEIYFV